MKVSEGELVHFTYEWAGLDCREILFVSAASRDRSTSIISMPYFTLSKKHVVSPKGWSSLSLYQQFSQQRNSPTQTQMGTFSKENNTNHNHFYEVEWYKNQASMPTYMKRTLLSFHAVLASWVSFWGLRNLIAKSHHLVYTMVRNNKVTIYSTYWLHSSAQTRVLLSHERSKFFQQLH